MQNLYKFDEITTRSHGENELFREIHEETEHFWEFTLPEKSYYAYFADTAAWGRDMHCFDDKSTTVCYSSSGAFSLTHEKNYVWHQTLWYEVYINEDSSNDFLQMNVETLTNFDQIMK